MSQTQTQTQNFNTPEEVVEFLLQQTTDKRIPVVLIDVYTNNRKNRRGWTFNGPISHELWDREYMKDMYEVVNDFRDEWPNGHSTVVIDDTGAHITVTLT
jgi:hypothetical protein